MGHENGIVVITVPAPHIEISAAADVIKIRFRRDIDRRIFIDRKGRCHLEPVVLDDPLALHITGKIRHNVRFMPTDESDRQPFQTGIGMLQIVPSAEKDDLRHIFSFYGYANVANDRKLGII